MQIKGAIFDMDGTLIDSMPAWASVGADYMRSRGLTPPEGLDDRILRMSLAEAAQYIKSCGADEEPDAIQRAMSALVDDYYRNKAELKPGVAELLAALEAAGVRMCVATATDRAQVEAALDRCGIARYFARVYTCTELETGKHEPKIFDAACAFLGAPRDATWVFEDARHAAETAKRAGYRVCAVYDASEPDQPALRATADLYFESLEKAPGIFFDARNP